MGDTLHFVPSRKEVVVLIEGLGPGGRKDTGAFPVESYVVQSVYGVRYVVAKDDLVPFNARLHVNDRTYQVVIEDYPTVDMGPLVISNDEYEQRHRNGEFRHHTLTTGRCQVCNAKVVRVGNPTIISGPEHAYCGSALCSFVIRNS